MQEKENLIDNNDTEISSIQLVSMLSKTADLVQEIFDKFYKKFKLSKTQFSALYRIYLTGDEGITLSTLGEQMLVTKANITSLIDRMVARGLVKRIINENDRRSIKAKITKDGRRIMEDVLPNSQVFSSEILNCLTKQEKKDFYELLSKVYKELTEVYFSD